MLSNNNVFCRLLVKLHMYFEVDSKSEWSIWCLESSSVQSPLARSDMQRFQRRWCSLALFLIQHVYGYNTTYSVTREHSVNIDLSVMNVAVCWCSAQYCALNNCTNFCHPVFMHVTITTLVCHMYFGSAVHIDFEASVSRSPLVVRVTPPPGWVAHTSIPNICQKTPRH